MLLLWPLLWPYYVFQNLYSPGKANAVAATHQTRGGQVCWLVLSNNPHNPIQVQSLEKPFSQAHHHLHWLTSWARKNTLQLLRPYSEGTCTSRYFKGRNMHTILSPEDFILHILVWKIHAQMKPEEDQMQDEIIEQKDSGFSNTQSFSVTLCCPVTCVDNSS